MALGGNDLTVTTPDGESHGYVLLSGSQYGEALVHSKSSPNVPGTSGSTNPAPAGGPYDVRDSEGDKAITHIDWSSGAGQDSLDAPEAYSGKYQASSYIDIGHTGKIKLLRPVVNTHVENTAGPVFSACGYLWLGGALGTLKYSSDEGANWSSATIGGTAITAAIGDFCTDGSKVFFCVPSGASKGIWANTAATPGTFAKYGSTGTTESIRHLAYNGGFLIGATTAGCAFVDTTTGVFSTSSGQKTPNFLNSTMTSVALASAGNAVYWVVAQGERSFVYQLTIDPNSSTMSTQQYMEMPSGFIATCALGYLSTLYIGGYFESTYDSVGKGCVYTCSDGRSSVLFEIGDLPEETDTPSSVSNDNRVYALCEAGKDLYALTNRACYRWDIDGGGYSHAFDFQGCGFSDLVTTWSAGSPISWDGTDPAGGLHLPAGYTVTEEGTGTPAMTYTAGLFKYTHSPFVNEKWTRLTGVCTPTAGNVFDNTNGTTVELAITECAGPSFALAIQDGTRECRMLYNVTDVYTEHIGPATFVHSILLLGYDEATSKWSRQPVYYYIPQYYLTTNDHVGSHTLKVVLQGGRSAVWFDGVEVISTYYNKYNAAENALTLQFTAGTTGNADTAEFISGALWEDAENAGRFTKYGGGSRAIPAYGSGYGPAYVWLDSILVNNAGAQASGTTSDTLFRPSMCHGKGQILAPYAVGTDAKSLTITQVVSISGSNSVPSIDGNYTATYIGADTFSIPVNVATTAGTAGTVKYNHNVGYTLTSTGYAPSGWLSQSPTSFHSGTILKDFRYVEVGHDPLPPGSGLTMQWEIDGVPGNAGGVTTGNRTRFSINSQGYYIQTMLGMTHDTSGNLSPVVRSVNVMWDFVKNKKRSYLLNCSAGARNGLWREDPQAAISFLLNASDQRCMFEDVFSGVYYGTIDPVQYIPASPSDYEGPSGIIKMEVRETA
jgi:hypothetical protein